MIRTYITPALVTGGDVVRVTQTGSSSKVGESNMIFRPVPAGDTGFYL